MHIAFIWKQIVLKYLKQIMENNNKKKSNRILKRAMYMGLGIILYRLVITPIYDYNVHTLFK